MRPPPFLPHLEELERRQVPTLFEVGPGHVFAALHEVPWDLVTAGDVVKVYYQPLAYHDKIQVANSGTSGQHISITGVPDADGRLPVLDAAAAIENPQASYFTPGVAAQAIISIIPSSWDYEVRYIDISNFEMRNANRDQFFFNAHGVPTWYNSAAAAVAMYLAEHITITGCTIHDNENGLFGKSYGYPGVDLSDVVVEKCDIFGNGRAGDNSYHNTYIEAIGMTYQFNHFGPPVQGSLGANVKDRSAGLVLRYNYVEGGTYMLDLVDPEDADETFLASPLFGKTYVYGNILYQPANGGYLFVYFGGDSGEPLIYQRNLYFYSNTVVNRNDADSGRSQTTLFDLSTNDQTVDLDNNIFFNVAATPGHSPGALCLAAYYGAFQVQTNWINDNYLINPDGGTTFEGTIVGLDRLLTGADPGFVDQASNDFRLTAASPCVGVADPPGAAWADHPVEYQYDYATGSWIPRATTFNLGAIE